MTTVYVVTSGSYSDYRIERVYLDRDEAYKYVEAKQKTYYSEVNDVEEYEVGAPPAEFDGPIWEGTFRQNHVQVAPSILAFDHNCGHSPAVGQPNGSCRTPTSTTRYGTPVQPLRKLKFATHPSLPIRTPSMRVFGALLVSMWRSPFRTPLQG